MSINEDGWELEKIQEETRKLEAKNHDLRTYIESLKEKKRKLRDAAKAREDNKNVPQSLEKL